MKKRRSVKLINGDCLKELKKLNINSIDSIITDPPYGIKFMNKTWDVDCPSVEVWQECLRVLKPGGFLLSFSGTRTIDFIIGRIREAGFEIRDTITWLYGSGFPKSHNISKGIDKKFGAEREVIGQNKNHRSDKGEVHKTGTMCGEPHSGDGDITAPTTDLTKQWDGWGTALKPSAEFIVMARKPFKGTVVDNVLKHGTGGINVDACRVEADWNNDKNKRENYKNHEHTTTIYEGNSLLKSKTEYKEERYTQGRFPANLILDEEAGEMLDEQSGNLGKSAGGNSTNIGGFVTAYADKEKIGKGCGFGDTGGASRFFYCAKASKAERNRGLEEGQQCIHPTVKPIKLMEYLVKLVTPPDGTVLDPFMGSGSTGVACKKLKYSFIGIELNKEYYNISKKRIRG